jgi:hypothetical protein
MYNAILRRGVFFIRRFWVSNVFLTLYDAFDISLHFLFGCLKAQQ